MPAPLDFLRQELLKLMGQPGFAPLRKRALAKKLAISDEDYPDFRHLVDEMVEGGELAACKRGKYGPPKPARKQAPPAARAADQAAPAKLPKNAIIGRIEVKRGGFGFLISDPPGNDVYLAAEDLRGALSGDLVAAAPKRGLRRGRPAARVVRVLERGHPFIVGTFYAHRAGRGGGPARPGGWVGPDTRGIFDEIDVLPDDCGEANDGDKVVIELLEPGRDFRSGLRPTGRVVQVYGEAGEARAEAEAIIRNFDLRTEYGPEVLAQAEATPAEIPDSELAQRVDYTALLTFTIDPADAKDHDDAVSLRALGGGRTELLVHIADVSHYVPEDSPLDREARLRGTSVYLPGRTLHMLPPRLAGDVCSLRPDLVRLTKTVAITYSSNLVVEQTRIERSFIRSGAFLTYPQVKRAVDDDASLVPSPAILQALRHMKSFSQALRRKRLEAGSIDLDLPEMRLVLDQHGAVRGWEKEEYDWSHQLIEEMMLAANCTIAQYLVEHEIPALFRVHEEPDPEDLARFAEFVKGFAITLRPPYDRHKLKQVLARVEGKDYRHAIHLALLTSLKQARYAAECHPHYALSFSRYLHFTSPIRRYPDLIVHRALEARFEEGAKALPEHGRKRAAGADAQDYYQRVAFLHPLAVHCSHRERQAADAEEEVKKVLQIQYLRHHRRESHPGVITRVVRQGLVVEMQDCFVEGFVRVEDLGDDWYEFFEDRHLLQGRRKRRSFRLGDRVSVRVASIDVGARKVGLILTEV